MADALSNTAATGLILGGGALGSALLVLGLTVLAVRRGARAEAAERRREALAKARSRTPPAHDPFPRQPYSPEEPTSHQPYSRPYTLPEQDSTGLTNGHLNGHQATEKES